MPFTEEKPPTGRPKRYPTEEVTTETQYERQTEKRTIPTQPRGPIEILEITKTTITISWLPPAFEGGAAISNYIIDYKETAKSWRLSARIPAHKTSHTISDLKEGKSYYFRVSAENYVGVSSPLVLNIPVSPRRSVARPSAPADIINVEWSVDGSPTLTWTEPEDDGGTRIIRYIIEYRTYDSFDWRLLEKINRRKISIPTFKSSNYHLRISAENEVGRSDALEIDLKDYEFMKKTTAPPSRPQIPLVITPAEGSIQLAWQPPKRDGSSDIISYVIEMRDIAEPKFRWVHIARVSSKIFTYEVKNLIIGHKYYFRICAENTAGKGEWLESRSSAEAKDPLVTPTSPNDLELVSINHEIAKIAWNEPSDNGGSPITGYIIEKREPGSPLWHPIARIDNKTFNYTIKSLSANVTYFIRVGAENMLGIGNWRELSDSVRLSASGEQLPQEPTNVRAVEISNDTIKLNWDTPISSGTAPLTGFYIEQKVGNRNWRNIGYDNPHRLWWSATKLKEGISYYFRVCAENRFGKGEWGYSKAIIPTAKVIQIGRFFM